MFIDELPIHLGFLHCHFIVGQFIFQTVLFIIWPGYYMTQMVHLNHNPQTKETSCRCFRFWSVLDLIFISSNHWNQGSTINRLAAQVDDLWLVDPTKNVWNSSLAGGLWNWEQFSTELSNHQLKYQQTVSFSWYVICIFGYISCQYITCHIYIIYISPSRSLSIYIYIHIWHVNMYMYIHIYPYIICHISVYNRCIPYIYIS